MLCASEFKSRLGHFLNPVLLIVSCQFLSISLYRHSPEIKSVCWKLSCENYVCVSLSAEACFSGDTVSACLCSLSLWWWPSLSLSHSKPPQEMSIGWGAEKAPWLTFNLASVMEKTHVNDIALCSMHSSRQMEMKRTISENQKALHLFSWWLLLSCSAFFIQTRANIETETLGVIVLLGLNVGQLQFLCLSLEVTHCVGKWPMIVREYFRCLCEGTC